MRRRSLEHMKSLLATETLSKNMTIPSMILDIGDRKEPEKAGLNFKSSM